MTRRWEEQYAAYCRFVNRSCQPRVHVRRRHRAHAARFVTRRRRNRVARLWRRAMPAVPGKPFLPFQRGHICYRVDHRRMRRLCQDRRVRYPA